MTTLTTSFAGLKLQNPIIVSSSGLTDNAIKNQRLAEAGAGAIVLKSLFEEQIMRESHWLGNPNIYPEGSDYLVEYIREYKLGEYLNLIKESKQKCNIPIIASINCFQNSNWIDFATRIEDAGADALEVNILALQTTTNYQYGSFEQHHIDILSRIRERVGFPIIMKLGSNFTNPIALIEQLHANGANGVVLFNRFYQPDINIEKLTQISGEVFSNENELPNILRWLGIASAAVSKIDYAASGGIHSAEAIIKAILAGASAVEICSTLYKNSSSIIKEYLYSIYTWMERQGMKNIEQFKGLLNLKELKGVNTFERVQFLKYFSTR